MRLESQGGQLEFSEWSSASGRRMPSRGVGRFVCELRHDQIVLAGIAALIGVALVFASGVERGKRLARAERSLLTSPVAVEPRQPAPVVQEAASERLGSQPVPLADKAHQELEGGSVTTAKKPAPAPSAPRKVKEAREEKVASKQYAIQVVTYSRPQLADRELQRLKARGEKAFLVTREGHTMLYIGPFPDRSNASEKLTKLKAEYRDCFLRRL